MHTNIESFEPADDIAHPQRAQAQLENELARYRRELDSRTRELNCWYRLSELMTERGVAFETLCRQIAELVPSALQFPERAMVHISMGHDLIPAAQLFVNTTAKALHTDRAAFWSYNSFENALKYEITCGSPPHIQAQWNRGRFDLDNDKGIATVAARTRQVVSVPDVDADPRWIAMEPELKSAMWAPIVYQDRLYGVLSVSSIRLAAFTASYIQLLVLFANQFARAMETWRLLNETQRRVHQLQSLHTIDNAISASFDLQLILDIYLDIVMGELHVDPVDILLFDSQLLLLTLAARRGFRTRAPNSRSNCKTRLPGAW